MKFAKLLTFTLLFILLNLKSTFAAPIELVQCHIPDRHHSINIQCTYSTQHPSKKLYVNTNMPYALCRNTLCEIDPKKPSIANCNCPIIDTRAKHLPAWRKVSVGTVFYEIIHPQYQGEKFKSVPANFSLSYIEKPSEYKNITCEFNQPTAYANCFGRRCNVEYEMKQNKLIPVAKCRCKIMKAEVFVSAGPKTEGECKTPAHQVWNGMTEHQAQNNIDVLKDSYKRFHPKNPTLK